MLSSGSVKDKKLTSKNMNSSNQNSLSRFIVYDFKADLAKPGRFWIKI